jgi:hypothetical protein
LLKYKEIFARRISVEAHLTCGQVVKTTRFIDRFVVLASGPGHVLRV